MADAGKPDSDTLFGQLVIEQGLARAEQVEECLRLRDEMAAQGITPLPRLGELLVRKGYLNQTQFEATLRISQVRGSGRAVPVQDLEAPSEVREAEKDPAHVVGRYVLTAKLGAGGMGEVWRAWDRSLRRWAALKFLKGDDPSELARFQREAQTAAKLAHPNIAAVYEVGEHEGRPHIAMQFIAGRTFATFPRDDRKRLAVLVRDAARALHYAHEQGVVHRDLKPHNLMVEGSDATLRVFVMDFGLAKQAALDSSLSVSGSILGTPAYMPPEQARGQLPLIDARSDVYSLGATLYELLADRPPFRSENVYDLLKKAIEEEPPPLRRFNPKIDVELETIVLKCLEKDPARRYPDAQAFADDLDRWLRGEAILAHPPSIAYRVRKYLYRHRAVAIPTAAAALLAVSLAAGAIWNTVRTAGRVREGLERGAREERAGRFREARDAYRSVLDLKEHPEATAGLARTDTALKKADAEKEAARAAQDEAIKLLEAGRPALDQAFRYLYNKDAVYVELVRRVEAGQKLIEQALEKAPNLSPAHYLLGRAWDIRGWDDRAEACWRKAIELDSSFGPPHYDLGRLLLKRSFLHSIMSYHRMKEARLPTIQRLREEGAKEIEAAQGRSGFDDEVQVLVAAAMVAGTRALREEKIREGLERFGKEGGEEFYVLSVSQDKTPEENIRLLDEALRLRPKFPLAQFTRAVWRKVKGDKDGALSDYTGALMISPRFANALVNRGHLRAEKGDWGNAFADYDAAIGIDPMLGDAFTGRAAAWVGRGNFDRAISDYTEALRLEPLDFTAFKGRGRARHQKGDFDGAIVDLERALQLEGTDVEALVLSGMVRQDKGDLEGALADFDRAVALKPGSINGLYARGLIRYARGDYEGAIADCNEQLRLNPRYAGGYVNRGNARRDKGDLEGAFMDFSEAIRISPTYAEAYGSRSGIRRARGDFEGAIADCDEALKHNPQLWLAHVYRGLAKLEKGDSEGAIADYGRAIQLAPNNASPWFNRGSARHKAGDIRGALADYDEAIRRDPRHVEAHYNRGLGRHSLGEKQAATEDLKKALQFAPSGWAHRAAAEAALKVVQEKR